MDQLTILFFILFFSLLFGGFFYYQQIKSEKNTLSDIKNSLGALDISSNNSNNNDVSGNSTTVPSQSTAVVQSGSNNLCNNNNNNEQQQETPLTHVQPESENDPSQEEIPMDEGNKEVFNIKNNIFSYHDADRVCKAFGAELATFEQVQDSYKKGASWCNYGWTQGQLALYPTQYKDWQQKQNGPDDRKNECGRPGVNGGYFDNPNLKFGVNCYGKKDEANSSEIGCMNSNMDLDNNLNEDSTYSPEEVQQINTFRNLIDNGEIQRSEFKCGKWSAN